MVVETMRLHMCVEEEEEAKTGASGVSKRVQSAPYRKGHDDDDSPGCESAKGVFACAVNPRLKVRGD